MFGFFVEINSVSYSKILLKLSITRNCFIPIIYRANKHQIELHTGYQCQ